MVLGYTAHAAGRCRWCSNPGGSFPAGVMSGDAFVTMRGSWNRKTRHPVTKIVRVPVSPGGTPQEHRAVRLGLPERWRRTATSRVRWGSRVARDGAAADGGRTRNGVIYRIAYRGTQWSPGRATEPRPQNAMLAAGQSGKGGVPDRHRPRAENAHAGAALRVGLQQFSTGTIPRKHSGSTTTVWHRAIYWSAVDAAKSYCPSIMEDPDAKPITPFVHWLRLEYSRRGPRNLDGRIAGGRKDEPIRKDCCRGAPVAAPPDTPGRDRRSAMRRTIIISRCSRSNTLLDVPPGRRAGTGWLAAVSGHVLAKGRVGRALINRRSRRSDRRG